MKNSTQLAPLIYGDRVLLPPLALLKEVLYQEHTPRIQLPVCDHYAGKPKFFAKALALRQALGPCFDITLDLEDGAELGQTIERAQWASHCVQQAATQEGPETRKPGVRVHPVTDPAFTSDLAALLQPKQASPAYVMLPKPEHVGDVRLALEQLHEYSNKADHPTPPLHVLIETHGALADVAAIAALPQVESLSFGIMDFISAHAGAIPSQAQDSPGQFNHPLVVRAKLEMAAACHRFGKVPSHNVNRQIQNPASAGEDAALAHQTLGYTRMWSIHPAQIQPIVQALQPRPKAVCAAIDILNAAHAANWGPIAHQGQLHDRASFRQCFHLVQQVFLAPQLHPQAHPK